MECLDKRKFGVPGRKKKACRYKKCTGTPPGDIVQATHTTDEYTYDGRKKLSSEEVLQVKTSLLTFKISIYSYCSAEDRQWQVPSTTRSNDS